MSKFLTHLKIEQATAFDDGNWRLLAPLLYVSLVARQVFAVPPGFVTNFASVPRLMFIYALFGGTADKAATLHDWLYTKPAKVPRRVADKVFREASKVTGVAAWRRWPMYWGVRLFGWSHYNTTD
jgi:hypothetical protein